MLESIIIGSAIGLASKGSKGAALGAVAGFLLARLIENKGGLHGLGVVADESRPSCIECVEKHIGAAMVLISEIDAGYPYRLRVIGHLHEAEDESKAFPNINSLVRDARKAYQSRGILPDFDRLQSEIGKIRVLA